MTNLANIFVSLNLCTRLMEHGLTQDTWAKYRQYSTSSEVHLIAPGFDHEGFYSALDLPEGVESVTYDTPAYTLTDMLLIIPGACISQLTPGHYEVAAFKIFDLKPQVGKNAPDTAAAMVLHALDNRALTVEKMNEILLFSPINNPR